MSERGASVTLALLRHGARARGGTRLACALFLAAAAWLVVLALVVAADPDVRRPTQSSNGWVLGTLMAAAAAAAVWRGTAREGATGVDRPSRDRRFAQSTDRALHLGGLLEAAAEGARAPRPGPFQGLLEQEVARRVGVRRMRDAAELPWVFALLATLAAGWFFLSAVFAARVDGDELRQREWLARAAALLASAAADASAPAAPSADGPQRSAGELLTLARAARDAARSATAGEPVDAARLEAALREVAARIAPNDPAAEQLESARLNLAAAAGRGGRDPGDLRDLRNPGAPQGPRATDPFAPGAGARGTEGAGGAPAAAGGAEGSGRVAVPLAGDALVETPSWAPAPNGPRVVPALAPALEPSDAALVAAWVAARSANR